MFTSSCQSTSALSMIALTAHSFGIMLQVHMWTLSNRLPLSLFSRIFLRSWSSLLFLNGICLLLFLRILLTFVYFIMLFLITINFFNFRCLIFCWWFVAQRLILRRLDCVVFLQNKRSFITSLHFWWPGLHRNQIDGGPVVLQINIWLIFLSLTTKNKLIRTIAKAEGRCQRTFGIEILFCKGALLEFIAYLCGVLLL